MANARRIAFGAVIIMAGSILSRILGLGRESTIALLFGAGPDVSAYRIAANVSTIIFDLLISGMVSAALVPVLSEYTAPDKREDLGRILGVIIGVALSVVTAGVVLLELFPEPLVNFMSGDLNPAYRQIALEMTRIVLPGLLFLGVSAVFMAAHFALQRFAYPSFAMASQNIALILASFVLGDFLGFGVQSLAYGMVLGSFTMMVLQWIGLRDVPIRISFDFRHPAVRRILVLYAPIALSLAVSSAALILDRRWANETGDSSVAVMGYATILIQFGLGIVGAAISQAALPSLSQHFANGDDASYRHTLGTGLRLVTVLSFVTAAGLFFLSIPLVTLAFQHGDKFTAEGKWLTVLALLCYLPGLPAAALDQVLIFGFYSRKNTIIPVMVGIGAVMVYAVTAFYLHDTLGMAGLVLGSSAQWIFHAIVTGILLYRTLGGLPGERIFSTLLKAMLGALLMGLVSFLVWGLLGASTEPRGLVIDGLVLAISGGAGLVAFLGAMALLRVPELFTIAGAIRRRLPGGRSVAEVEQAADALRADELAATYDLDMVSSEPFASSVAAQAAAQPTDGQPTLSERR